MNGAKFGVLALLAGSAAIFGFASETQTSGVAPSHAMASAPRVPG